MATKTTTKTTAAANNSDAIALKLKAEGATWKFIATVHLGVEWAGANMDGGRALRAVNRAKRAGVDVAQVKLPVALAKQLAAAKAPKGKGAVANKAATKRVVRKTVTVKPDTTTVEQAA